MPTSRNPRPQPQQDNHLWWRCLFLMAGMLFFLLLAASRARGAEGYDDEWSFPEEDAYDMMSADDHLLSQRMLRKMTSARPVYGHEKAARIHDSVTIVVNETTSSDISSSNDLKRDSSNNMNLTNWLTPSLGSMKLTQRGEEANGNTPTLSYNTARSHKSDSTIERTQNFSTTLTGEVVEVLPNRYLVVQARKSVEINGETQTVIVTGTVNPDHLDSNSSIKAEQVMDMSVRYSGNGPMTRMDRRGWGSKIIDFINPF